MRFFAITVFMLVTLPAVAQQAPPSPMEQSLSAKLLTEINSGLQCGAGLASAQTHIKQLEAKIAELEKKAGEAKPPEGK